jgi:putative redox protein
MNSKVELKEGMHFIGTLDGFDIKLDADEQFGGKNKGSKPKGLVLTALAGCTAMDVASILRKMRVDLEKFSVEVTADLTDSHPSVFKSFLIKYYFKSKNITEENAKKSIELSLDKYCGVAAMLKKVGEIKYEMKIER